MFQNKPSFMIILLTLALALLASACQEAKAPLTNEVVFTAHDNSFSGPDTISAGWTQLGLVNEGPEFYHIQLVKLDEGKTMDDLVSVLEMDPVRPDWARLFGGPNPPVPGQRSEATVRLDPGQYALIDTVPDKTGTPHIHYGMAKALTVTPAKGEMSEPESDVTIDMGEFNYTLSPALTAGPHTIRVNNKGQQPHEVFLAKLAPGKSVNDLLASLAPDAPPEAIDWQALGGISAIEPGTHAYFSIDLEPGHYALICFAPEQDSGMPHFMMGMAQEITVEPVAGDTASGPESAPVTRQYVNEALGYSLYYPEVYSVEAQENGDTFVIGSSMNHSDPRLQITVSDAEGATARSTADALINNLAGFDMDLERYTIVIDGLEAQVVEGVPGQEISRVVFLVDDGRLFQLSFTHADESLGDKYVQMEQLFGIVTDSFLIIR